MCNHQFRRQAFMGPCSSALFAAMMAGCGGPSELEHRGARSRAQQCSDQGTRRRDDLAGRVHRGNDEVAGSHIRGVPCEGRRLGDAQGEVLFGGDPPVAKVLVEQGKAEKNPEVCAKDSPIKSQRLVVDPASKGVKFALVYLPRPTAVNDDAKKSMAGRKVEFDQKGCVFEPHVLGLMAGVPITLKSSDPANHNVNVKLKNSTFNQTVAGGASFPFTPSAPERTPGQVVCDIHPWMTSWWMVLDNPYFAVTDDKGNFEIKNVPAGTQKVVVWQEAVSKGGFVTPPSGEDINIKPGDATVKDFTIDPTKLLPGS